MLRKLKGALGIVATWGVVWAAVFGALATAISFIDPGSIDPGETVSMVALIGSGAGFLSGAAFALLLGIFERGKKLGELSVARSALWGAIAATVLPLISPADNMMIVFMSPIGALLAAGSIAGAKRAELRAASEQARVTAT